MKKKNLEDLFVLTPVQEGMLFYYLKDSGTDLYFEQLTLELLGEIDMVRFKQAWQIVIDNNEMLRTQFYWEKMKNPVQIVLKEQNLHLKVYDLTRGDRQNNVIEEELKKIKTGDKEEKFDLRDVPFRIKLVKAEKDKYFMIISNHHILYDGWSNGIIFKEFFEAYDALSKGIQPNKTRKTKFKEFVKWVRAQDEAKQQKFWSRSLEGFDFSTKLPVIKGVRESTGEIARYTMAVPAALRERLDWFTRSNSITLVSLLYSTWGILLQRYNNNKDVVFGTTVSGRSAKINGIENIVGLFLNTLPLRVTTTDEDTVISLLSRVNCTVQEREKYETTSLAGIKAYIPSQNNEDIFRSIVVIENYPIDKAIMKKTYGLTVRSYSMMEINNYDLTIEVTFFEGMKVHFSYDTEGFDGGTIARISGHFIRVWEEMIIGGEQAVCRLELLSAAEKHQLLYDFNNTGVNYRGSKTLHRLLEEPAGRVLEKIAVIDEQNHSYCSYGELERRSTGLARLFREKGVTRGTLVGLAVGAVAIMAEAILGILKAGGGCVPMDPHYPLNRIRYMMADSGIRWVVTYRNRLLPENFPVCVMDLADNTLINKGITTLENNSHSRDLAFLLYTSQAGGKPKGVMIDHSAVVNRIGWIRCAYPLGKDDVVYSGLLSLGNLAGWEQLETFSQGAAVCLARPGTETDPRRLTEVLIKNKVTVLHILPMTLAGLLEFLGDENKRHALSLLRQVFAGGAAIEPGIVKKFHELLNKPFATRLTNLFRSVEVTGYAAHFDIVTAQDHDLLPAGKPIANTGLYLLDRAGMLQPLGIEGELFISGDGLARGYLNSPELTRDKFDHDLKYLWDDQDKKTRNNKKFLEVSEPFFKKVLTRRRQKLYRTGIRGHWRYDGNVQFLGRTDRQVKIKGLRVEPGEIEAQLLQHERVKDAVVIAPKISTGISLGREAEPDLWVYFCSRDKLPVQVSELESFLAAYLPDYMVPRHFVQLEELPGSSRGQVDRQLLLTSVENGGGGSGLEVAYCEPASEIEKVVAATWQEVLQLEKVGIHDNLFDVGGNSLKILRINTQLVQVLDRRIPLAAMFRYPTIAAMARFLSQEEPGGEIAPGAWAAEESPGTESPGTGYDRGETKEFPAPLEKKPGSPSGSSGDIAVIGMAGRFPGAGNIEAYWENLKKGIEAIVFFSDKELVGNGLELGLVHNPGYVRAKGLLENIDCFDASFFDYSAKEAELMDPQLRIFQECAWESLEDAGYETGSYDGRLGIYAGSTNNYHWTRLLSLHMDNSLEEYRALILSGNDFLTTRTAYKLDVKGPCFTVQTACSTSLAAVVIASQALADRQCDMALAGGVTASASTKTGYMYDEGMIFSADGHCRAFESKASGIVPGEGAGLVVLKRYEDAVNDGDHLYAVVKGAALNNDGLRKVGFTAPSVNGQEEVIRTALQRASVPAATIGYIETHGTGTKLGDPVEFDALQSVFATGKRGYCCIGSVKTNVGHLDVAAGITGFIKAVLCLKDKIIPPTLHFESPNPDIQLEGSPFYINSSLLEWKSGPYPRRAGVSSFGVGGTNAHVILEECPGQSSPGILPTQSSTAGKDEPSPGWTARGEQLILLSARTPSALAEMTQNLAGFFKTNPGIDLAGAAYTLQVGRKHFKYRRMVVSAGSGEAAAALSDPGAGKLQTFLGEMETSSLIFMFPGQGTQYVNMARELYETVPLFHREMTRCFEILKPLMGFDLKEILYPGDGERGNNSPADFKLKSERINQSEIAQPAIFAVEYALAQLLLKWVGKPDAMIGHSIGEFTAACLSGVFSLEEALTLVAARGRLMQQMPTGSMLGVSLPVEELSPGLPAGIDLASVNSSSFCVLAGPTEAIDAFETHLKQKGCRTRRLYTSHAYHSRMMAPVLEPFERQVRKIALKKPHIPYISNVSGTWIKLEEVMDPRYWAKHLRTTVKFATGLKELLGRENGLFLEVGPGMMLSTFVNKHLDKQPGHKTINLLKHPHEPVSDITYLLNKLGHLWLYGKELNWTEFHGETKKQRCSLPTYPFARQSYWPGKADNGAKILESVKSPPGEREKKDIADWFYIPSWERAVAPPHKPLDDSLGKESHRPCWVIFSDEVGLGDHLLERLAKDHTVVMVKAAAAFSKVKENQYTMAPRQPRDYDTIAGEIRTLWLSGASLRILHLWGVGGGSNRNGDRAGELERETVQELLDLGFYSLFHLVRSLGKQEISGKIQLTVVTDNLQEVTGDEELCPARAPVLGLVKIIPLEYPGIDCRSIDITLPLAPGAKPGRLVDQLLAECDSPSPGPVTAYRGKHRWVPVFKPVRFEKTGNSDQWIKERGVYLVTGGFGGFGFSIAKELAKRVSAGLILIGRSFFPDRPEWDSWLATHEEENKISIKIKEIREMEARGAQVMIFKADVSEEKQMQEVIARVKKRFAKLDGVIHTAGIADFGGILQNRSRESIAEVLAAKLWGTLVLSRVLRDMAPGFFLLCSSISNTAYHHKFGQAAYNAANEFLDAFAGYHAARSGWFTVSVNWPDWKEVGMAVEASNYWSKILDTDPRVLLQEGILISDGIEVFMRTLGNSYPRVMVSPTDLESKVTHGAARFYAALEKSSLTKAVHQRPELTTPYSEPVSEAEKKIAEIWQKLLGITEVGIHDNFFELGATSLDLIQANHRLKEIFNREIPAVSMYTYSTIHSLSGYLNREETGTPAPGKDRDAYRELDKARELMKQTMGKFGIGRSQGV